jgi:hypothetical protein
MLVAANSRSFWHLSNSNYSSRRPLSTCFLLLLLRCKPASLCYLCRGSASSISCLTADHIWQAGVTDDNKPRLLPSSSTAAHAFITLLLLCWYGC